MYHNQTRKDQLANKIFKTLVISKKEIQLEKHTYLINTTAVS